MNALERVTLDGRRGARYGNQLPYQRLDYAIHAITVPDICLRERLTVIYDLGAVDTTLVPRSIFRLTWITISHIIKLICLLGGEPFEIENQRGIISLIRKFKERFSHKNIWVYTGFTYDKDLVPGGKRYCEVTDEILDSIDILVDGKFILEQKNISLKFRGSENQRIIDMKHTRKEGHVVLSPLNN